MLPAEGDVFSFAATVQLMCSVSDPARIVQQNVVDVRKAIEPSLIGPMRMVSRDHGPEDGAAAESAITEAVLASSMDLAAATGIAISHVAVELRLEESSLRHFRTLQQQRQHLYFQYVNTPGSPLVGMLATRPDEMLEATRELNEEDRRRLYALLITMFGSDEELKLEEQIRLLLEHLRKDRHDPTTGDEGP